MKRKAIGFVFLVLSAAAIAQSPVVKTHSGAISGVATKDGGVVSFKGIPFAAAPVGQLRWKAPKPVSAWKETLKADHFGASCMQGPNSELLPWTKEFMYVTPVSEDCLFLNVWTPKASAAAKLPVLVYIHGGAFTSGSGDVPVYDGEALARTGMVIVTINYRLGVLGFLAHPALTAESEHHSSGNYGLLDQIEALRWVKENIGAFGGDAARVTIVGQSAGAMSVADLLASPLAKGLFSGAIADSGIGGRGVPMQTLDEAEKSGEAFASAKKAASIEALRALPASEFAKPGGRFAPIVDGWVVPENAIAATEQKGSGSDVPVITGFQANDAALGGGRTNAAEQFQNRAKQAYGPMAEEFLKLYPAASDEEAKQSGVASGRDRLKAGMYLWASKRAETHKSPVYIYYFDRAVPWPAHPEYGAFHSGELPYTFGNLAIFDRPWEPVDRTISKMMMTYWKDFSSSGDPNGASVPRWPVVEPGKPVVMRLGAESGPMPVMDAAKLDFWKRYFESPESKNAGPF
ncbi:carboxylesterase/lipase family protein [Occallatibacter savannae]|uniref:carboxylesterase/lipase family protein n=1 Tax=Occallatibacter savannae TaxID=1002691 RepID=UPI000D6954EF|nr:carboxylesterase family protein [Occallatibacter savannae]